MSLLIAILMFLGLSATEEQLNNADFRSANESVISNAQSVLDENRYVQDAGGNIIDVRL